MKKILLLAAALFLFAGCASKGLESANSKALNGNSYSLEGSLPNNPVVITFTDTTVVGNAGVNRFFADYEIVGNDILIKTPGSTKMMGDPVAMAQEDQFLKDLSEALTINFTNGKKSIIIKTSANKELKFNKTTKK